MIPESPRFAASSEELVWNALRDQLTDTDLLISGQRVTDHTKDHEIDIVAAIDGAGIMCLEVKGGGIWHDKHSWWQERPGRPPKRIDPVMQVRNACYALRDFIEDDPQWTMGRVRWDHMVVFRTRSYRWSSPSRTVRGGRSSTAPSSTRSCHWYERCCWTGLMVVPPSMPRDWVSCAPPWADEGCRNVTWWPAPPRTRPQPTS